MKPEDRPYFNNLTDAQLLGLCIWAEARGEGEEGRIAVGSVILNRVKHGRMNDPWGRRYGRSVHTVIMAPYQFSWLNSNDPQYKRCVEIAKDWVERDAPGLDLCMDIAEGLLDGTIKRNVSSLYYHALYVKPKWADKMVVERTIGNHVFYVELTTPV